MLEKIPCFRKIALGSLKKIEPDSLCPDYISRMIKNTENISNEQLVVLYQNGNKDALKLLIKSFQPKMLRTIRYYTQSNEPADDLAQECWYHIIRQLGQVELKISFDAWAITIAKRKSIDWIRHQQRSRKMDRELIHQSVDDDTNTDDESTAEDDRRLKLSVIQTAIRQLPHSKKIVLSMFYLENLSVKEIGSVLHISTGTVKSRLFHAREDLKKIIST